MCATVVITDTKLELIKIINYIVENPSYKEIHLYSNVNLAMNEIQKIKCQLIFVDADMNLLNAKEWIRLLVKKYPDINLVVVSANDSFALEALKIGAIDFFMKPITQETILIFEEKFEKRFSNEHILTENQQY